MNTKHPLRRIVDIVNCKNLKNNMFEIEIIENGNFKKLIYECNDFNTRKEIIEKLKYLLVLTILNRTCIKILNINLINNLNYVFKPGR